MQEVGFSELQEQRKGQHEVVRSGELMDKFFRDCV